MAVLNHDPFTIFHRVLDEHLSLWSLTLTKRNRVEFLAEAHFTSKLEENTGWISTLGQDEDKRSERIDLLVEDIHCS